MLVICLFLLQTMLLQADGQMLTSTLEVGSRFACPDDTRVTFTCTVEEASSLRWVADPFISASNPITFLANNPPGTGIVRDSFSAQLTVVSQVNLLLANLTSTLSISDVSILNGATVEIQCIEPPEAPVTSNLSVEGEMNNARVYNSGDFNHAVHVSI